MIPAAQIPTLLPPPPSVCPPGSPDDTVFFPAVKEETRYHVLTSVEKKSNQERCAFWKIARDTAAKDTHPYDRARAEYSQLKLVHLESRLQEKSDQLSRMQDLYHGSQQELQNTRVALNEVREANQRLEAQLDAQKRRCEDQATELESQAKKARKEIDALDAAKWNLTGTVSNLQAQNAAMVTQHEEDIKLIGRSLKEEKVAREKSEALLRGIQQQVAAHLR